MSWEAEQLGAHLVMEIRREGEQEQQLQETKARIDALVLQIRTLPAGVIYSSTSEIPVVTPAEQAERFEHRRNLGPLPTLTHRLDPNFGHTERLNPVSDAITEKLSPVTPCPRTYGEGCPELHTHVHTADGNVVSVRDM